MPTSTYEPIATYTVTGSNLAGETGVTFSNIPNTYTDLVIVQVTKLTAPAIGLWRVGNTTIDTGNNYSQTSMSGNGAAQSARNSSVAVWTTVLSHMTNTGWGTYITNIQNYSDTNTYKSALHSFNDTPYSGVDRMVSLWRSQAAIGTVKLFLDRAEFYVVGSTFNLYGIKAS